MAILAATIFSTGVRILAVRIAGGVAVGRTIAAVVRVHVLGRNLPTGVTARRTSASGLVFGVAVLAATIFSTGVRILAVRIAGGAAVGRTVAAVVRVHVLGGNLPALRHRAWRIEIGCACLMTRIAAAPPLSTVTGIAIGVAGSIPVVQAIAAIANTPLVVGQERAVGGCGVAGVTVLTSASASSQIAQLAIWVAGSISVVRTITAVVRADPFAGNEPAPLRFGITVLTAAILPAGISSGAVRIAG
jgi:hypothetical protein